jgi:putative heme-binding domain-containing protein
LATVDLKSALPQIAGVLKAQTAEADLLDTWRRLLGVKDAGDALAGAMPSDLSKEAAAAGVRVAREQGKKGEKLAAALAPIARIDLAATAPPADYTWLVDRARRDGDPGRGEEIYRRGSLACVTCHAIGGAGGKVGPELGTIGASAPLDYIIESLVAPAAKVKEGYHAVTVTLKDGSMLTGVLARETSDEVIVRNAVGIEQKAAKANITAKENMGSIMPAGLIEQLKDREKIDLYAFLAVLGKAGVYDASKGTVARSWWLYSAKEIGAAGIGGLTGGAPAPVVFPNVDGRLPRERLSESLALLGDAESVIAVAKFTATSAVKTKLQLLGVREAWLDGTALPVASEPSLPIDATAGEHVLAVKIDAKHLPEFLSASADGVRFLTE